MKATLRKMMIVAAMVVATFSVFAQQLPELTDPNVRIGKLDNGLTYYCLLYTSPSPRDCS